MKVRRAVLPKVHSDGDAIESAELRHRLQTGPTGVSDPSIAFPVRSPYSASGQNLDVRAPRDGSVRRHVHPAEESAVGPGAKDALANQIGKIDLPGHAVRVAQPDPVPVSRLHLERSNHLAPLARQSSPPAAPLAAQPGLTSVNAVPRRGLPAPETPRQLGVSAHPPVHEPAPQHSTRLRSAAQTPTATRPSRRSSARAPARMPSMP